MNTSNLIITTIVGIVAIALFVLGIQFLSKKINYEEEGKLKTAFVVWTGFMIAGFAMFLSSSIKAISNALEILTEANSDDSTLLVIEKIAIFTGFTFVGFAMIYFITQFVTAIIFGKRTNNIEIERDNYTYFIFKGALLLALTFSPWNVFENVLRLFSPVVDTPFYH